MMKHDKTNSVKLRFFLMFKKIRLWVIKPALDKQTVFISGMQRSGTNMLMKILDYNLNTDVYHETDNRAFDHYEMRNRAIIKKLLTRSSAPTFIIKSLFELQDIAQLMTDFSPAKTVWIVRSYDDVSNSILASFRENIIARTVRAVKESSDEWLAAGMSQQTKDKLSLYVNAEMSEASAAAVQWYFRNILFFEQQLNSNENVLVVKYEDLVSKPDVTIQRVCQFIGITFRKRMIDDIFASSISRKDKPDISPEIRKLCGQLTEKFAKLF